MIGIINSIVAQTELGGGICHIYHDSNTCANALVNIVCDLGSYLMLYGQVRAQNSLLSLVNLIRVYS